MMKKGNLVCGGEILTPIEVFNRRLLPGMGKNQVYKFINDHVPHIKLGARTYVHTLAIALAVSIPDFKKSVDEAGMRLATEPQHILNLLIKLNLVSMGSDGEASGEE